MISYWRTHVLHAATVWQNVADFLYSTCIYFNGIVSGAEQLTRRSVEIFL